MKRLLLLLAILFCWVGCEEEPTPVLVSVVTGEATDITTNSASVQVSMDKNDRIDEIGVLCSADSLFQVSTIKNSTQDLTNTTYRFSLSNLTAGTKYFYRAYATSKSSSIYGSTKSFQTKEIELTTSLDNIGVSDESKTYPVEIRSNTEWKAVSNQEWCTVSPEMGTGRDSIYIHVQENTVATERQAVVSVTAGNKTKEIKVSQSGRDASLSVSSNYFSVSPERNTYELQINTNQSWTLSSNQSWCTVSSSSGNGDNTVSFTVTENTAEEERTAVLTVQAGELSQKITVVQQSKSAMLSVSTNSFSVNADANTYSFTITSNMDWTVSSDQSWCSLFVTNGTGNQEVSFQVSENTSDQARNATITVRAGSITQEIVVTQKEQEKGVFEVSPSSFTFGSEGGTGVITYTGGYRSYHYTYDYNWIEILDDTSNRLKFEVKENDSTEPRVGNFTITIEDGRSATVTIVQSGAFYLSVSPRSMYTDAEGETVDFLVSSNSDWTVLTNCDWCKPQKVIGSGNELVTCIVDPNMTSKERTAIITVNATGKFEQVTITQGANWELTETIDIPDVNFKTYLVENYDVDKDGEISKEEALNITDISCNDGNINSLEGIEQIPNLLTLVCRNNNIKNINVSNSKLVFLDCSENPLETVNVSSCKELETFQCNNANLIQVDLSKNAKLTFIGCSQNQLTKLDVTNNTLLESLYCGFNEIPFLDTSKNTKLKIIDCHHNQITELILPNSVDLVRIGCHNNLIKNLDTSFFVNLETLYCDNNDLGDLDLSNNLKLSLVDCYANPNMAHLYLKTGQVIEKLNKADYTEIVYK